MKCRPFIRPFLILSLLIAGGLWGRASLRRGAEQEVTNSEPQQRHVAGGMVTPTPTPQPTEPAKAGANSFVEGGPPISVYVQMTKSRAARMARVPRAGRFADPELRQAAVDEAYLAHLAAEARAEAWSRETGIPRRQEKEDGGSIWLADVDPISGPLWLQTFTSLHAIGTGSYALEAAPYGLTGAGQVALVLDDGSARATHQDFGGRVTLLSGASVTMHATGAVGTLAGSGAGNAVARGVAPAATILSDTWGNDLGKMLYWGMAAPAEPDKVQISNHSYGGMIGWHGTNFYGGVMPLVDGVREWDGRRESSLFGSYSNTASNIDGALVDMPYYLPVVGAGNDRNTRGVTSEGTRFGIHIFGTRIDWFDYDPAIHPIPHAEVRGGYDTQNGVIFTAAKNVLTVGAAQPPVRDGERNLSVALPQPVYSNWGPMDDGRIKPDIVGPTGHTTTYPENDSAYGSYSGTSGASPTVAGSILLLLEHYDQLFAGDKMRAATIKALVLHTADALDSVGPNGRNGWGMINVQTAADHLLAHHANPDLLHLLEDVLTVEEPVVEYVFYWDESSPVRATLSWTDPRSYAISPDLNNRQSHLCNDLDLRIIDPLGNTHYPWKLNPEDPAAPATQGDNTVDTVEQVFIAEPPVAGMYTLRVSHKGTLRSSTHQAASPIDHQHFSLVLSGQTDSGFRVTPTLTHVAAGDSVTLTVSMIGPPLPSVNVDVTQVLPGDAGYTVSPASLSFTEASWSQPQSVTVSLVSPYTREDGYAEFHFDAGVLGEETVRVYGDDTHPPTRITDLWFESNLDEMRGMLRWTAPGDAESEVVAYELRRSAEPLTEANWNSAELLEGVGTPGTPGTAESFWVDLLEAGQTHHFAIRSRDVAGNWSEISNPAIHTVPAFLWRAYHNTEAEVANPSGNVTVGSPWDTAVPLLRISDGAPADGATLRMTYGGASVQPGTLTTVLMPSGTDVSGYFQGILDIDTYYSLMNGPGELWLHFENLEPGTYDLTLGMFRGVSNRSRFTLDNVLAASPKSSPGVVLPGPMQADLPANTGEVVRWENIVPDGNSFRVQVTSPTGIVFYLPQLLRLQRVPGPAVFGMSAPDVLFEEETIRLSVDAFGGAGLVYQWYQGLPGDESAPLANGDGATVEISGLAPGVYNFWVNVSDATGSAPPQSVTVTVLPTDEVPPEAVSDLTRVTQGSTSVYLEWTAPADTGSWVQRYELRYSTAPLTAENFTEAAPVSPVPTPAEPGETQGVLVSGLQPATLYYFALVSVDFAGNVSALSNVAQASTGQLTWSAYHNTESGTADPNPALVSSGRINGQAYALLKYADGTAADGATLTVTHSLTNGTNAAVVMPNAGTDAHDLFAGRLGLLSRFAYATTGSALLTFSNLPDGRYDVALTLNRGNTGNLTRLTLQGAASFTPASSAGIHDAGDEYPATVVLNSDNTAPGHVARWKDIEPIDGSFSILVNKHSGSYFYLPQLIRLQAEPLSARITAQPQDVTLVQGESTVLSVEAVAGQGTLSYQWYAGQSGNRDVPISGATSASLPLGPMDVVGDFAYWVEVSDYQGSVDSDTATVTVLAPDNTPPETVQDLAVGGSTPDSVTLTWTAPADVGTGTASYEMRRSFTPITEANFLAATPVENLPVPGPAGDAETVTVTGLEPETLYYFALRSRDHADNVSEVSNGVSVTTPAVPREALRVLWFGNSLSPAQIQQTITALTGAADIPSPVFAVQQLFGAALAEHLGKLDQDGAANVIDSLPAGQNWDVVVIQGSSTESSTLYGDTRAAFEADALALFTRVRNHSPQVRAVLYEVWARPPHNFPGAPYTGGVTPGQLQEEIRDSHHNVVQAILALGNPAEPAPVGTAMEHFNFFEPSLYNQDYHLSQNLGRIFAGMVLYNTLYGETVSGLDPAEASIAELLNSLGHTAEAWSWMAPYADDPYFQSLRIDTQPQDAFVVLNGSGTLAVEASTPTGTLSFQWYQGEKGDTTHPIPGVDSATYLPPAFTTVGNYSFWVRVDNGSETRDSRAATLTVRGEDLTPPAAVADLQAESVSGGRVSLAWTAPADVGWGTAAYEIRYSLSPLTAANFDAATAVPQPPIPGIPGSIDRVDVIGLQSETDYWFALRTLDEAGNVSALSNVLTVRTLPPAGNVRIDDFNTGTGNLPASSNLASTVQAEWRGIPSSAGSGFVRRQDGHLRLHRTWRNTQRQAVGIWLRVADYPGLVAGETYHLRFNYAVGREGTPDYRNNAWMRVSVAQRTTASYVEARSLDSATGPTLHNANAVWSPIHFEAGPDVSGERAWDTHTSTATFTLDAGADLIFVHVVAQGFGIEGGTSDWDQETNYTWLGLDEFWFVAAGAAPAGPVILSQPQSVTVAREQGTVLSVIAATATASMGFQWYSGTSGDMSQPLPGALGPQYTVPARHHAGTHSYWVRVSDDDGVAFSDTATVTVHVPDSDADGLPDWWEQLHFGGITAVANPDTPAANPRHTLRQAFIAGLDPTNETAEFDLAQVLQNGEITLVWTPAPGRVYRIKETGNLRDGFVSVLASGLRVGTYIPPPPSSSAPRFFLIEVMLDDES